MRERKLTAWLALISIYTLVLLSNYLFSSWGNVLLAKQNQAYSQQVRAKALQHWFWDGQAHPVAAAQNRLTNDLALVTTQYFAMIPQIVYFSGFLVFAILELLLIHWSLLLVSLLSVFISLLLARLFAKAVQNVANNLSLKNKSYLKVTGNWFRGIAELQRYAAGEKLILIMKDQNNLLRHAHLKQTRLEQLMSGVSETVAAIFHFVLFALAGFLISRGTVPFGVIAVIGSYSSYITMGLRYIPVFKGMMVRSKQVLDEVDQAAVSVDHALTAKVPAVAVSWQNLSLKLNNGGTLHFPDGALQPGEKVLLTGASGSGKTTLFNLLLGKLTPSRGAIVYQAAYGQKLTPQLSQVTYIPQKPVLFPVSILDNMTMFNVSLAPKAKQVVASYHFDQDIAQMAEGFDTMIDLEAGNVSGGQRQKIVLARTIINHAPIIWADEATSAIDRNGTLAVVKTLLQTDATVLFVAHNFDEQLAQGFDREIKIAN